jgi:hypothetical protein
MPIPRSRILVFLVSGAFAFGTAGCSTDDAAKRDAKDAQQEIDKGAGKADEKVGKAIEDVDGK